MFMSFHKTWALKIYPHPKSLSDKKLKKYNRYYSFAWGLSVLTITDAAIYKGFNMDLLKSVPYGEEIGTAGLTIAGIISLLFNGGKYHKELEQRSMFSYQTEDESPQTFSEKSDPSPPYIASGSSGE